jgi:hypothetical protein
VKCEWGEALRGTTCPTCHGDEKVRLIGQTEPVTGQAARSGGVVVRTCVLHPSREAARVCVLSGINARLGVVRDFCADCIEEGADDWNFGRCYLCGDGDHAHCIGVPCQCPCDGPTDLGRLENEIAEARMVLADLEAKRDAAVSS